MKKFIFVFVIIFSLPLFIVGCNGTQQEINSYEIVASYDETNQSLLCQEKVIYINNTQTALDKLCFFLYANAFNEGQGTVTVAYNEKAYPNGKSFGDILFDSVQVGEKETEYLISEKKNIMTIVLGCEIFPTEKIEVNLSYTINLANINHRLGYGENAVNFGNFFPIACVYEEGTGFVQNEFSASGDPFYSDVANFYVEVTYPEKFVMASSGVQQEISKNGLKTTTCKATKVRDFSFVLCDKFEKISQKIGKIDVNYYFYNDENAQEHLQVSVDALSTFQEFFGKYPYQQLSVVQTNFCFGGMEYPNLVMISDAIQEDETYKYVIVHEIAHQWWYGLVGNNQYQEAWVDEGLTEFSTALFFQMNEKYGFNYDTIMQNAIQTYKTFVEVYAKIYGAVDESMNRNLREFDTEPEYVNCTYTKGMLMFDGIRKSMSDSKFFKCLRNYFEEYKYQNSSAIKMIQSFSKSAGVNVAGYFEAWVEGNVVIQ